MGSRNKIRPGVGLGRRKTGNRAVAYARAQGSPLVDALHSMSASLIATVLLRNLKPGVPITDCSSALTHNSDPVDEQENDSRDRDRNRRPMKTGEISHHRERKRDGGEQGTSDVRSNLLDDKSLPMQILKSEKLAE